MRGILWANNLLIFAKGKYHERDREIDGIETFCEVIHNIRTLPGTCSAV